MNLKNRNQALDILRAVAVFLVLLRHVNVYAGLKTQTSQLAAFFSRGGWIGVDLFFVLSGFLIAQLLFKEHKKFGVISLKNFLIRRGFKIYPPYYVMMLITTLLLSSWNALSFRRICLWSFPWLVYLQDYWQTPLTFIWGHTWSLAVEEQFYICLPLLLILLAKAGTDKEDPFKRIPAIFIFIASACLLIRIANSTITPFDGLLHMTAFHSRIDSLFCGVFVAYLTHYHPLNFFSAVKRHRFLLLFAGMLLILPPFFFEITRSVFIYTYQYTFLYIGNALILMTVIVSDRSGTSCFEKMIAYIGARSYSIYLWHIPIAWLIHQPQAHLSWLSSGWFYVVYLIVSILLGIFIANILELPVLKLRDRFYPSRST